MWGKRYTEQFKIEAVKQITDQGHARGDVAKRLTMERDILKEAAAFYYALGCFAVESKKNTRS